MIQKLKIALRQWLGFIFHHSFRKWWINASYTYEMSEIKILLTGLVMEASALTSSSEGKKKWGCCSRCPGSSDIFSFWRLWSGSVSFSSGYQSLPLALLTETKFHIQFIPVSNIMMFHYVLYYPNQGCGSGLIQSGARYGSSNLAQSGSGYGSGSTTVL
jgi:hypothetical protein